MRRRIIFSAFLALIASHCMAQQVNVNREIKTIEQQVGVMLKIVDTISAGPKGNLVEPRTLVNGKLKMVNSNDWTSGFFPGLLWYLYDYTGNSSYKGLAQKFNKRIEKEQFSKNTHDLGFMIYCSFGNGYRLTNDTAYRSILVQAAKSLSTRFNPMVGAIRSWDHHADAWQYPVIIDNMMNLELLFEATKLTGDSSYFKIAVQHANTTLKNHFRPDHSSYHVVDYNPANGKVNLKVTAQGYSNESAWARGQAWGLYGYTLCYRFTRNPVYLAQAEAIAKFILTNPNQTADLVPYWDYNAPNISDAPRDASAAAITASALYELGTYSKAGHYRQYADKILSSLTKNYRSPIGENAGFILLHSTGHLPAKSEIDVPINYADYYYLEALLRSKRMK
ncbi:MAG: glycoside hydrolase family 88 protein [Bacteroidota bacterium]